MTPLTANPTLETLETAMSPITASPPMETVSVPLTRLDFADPELLEELLGTVREVAERGAFTLGDHVESFEREFAAYCETDFAIGVSSGTEALALALRALEIGPGDEVIVPTNSFIASAEAVSAVGATPRLVDVDPDSHLLTAEIVADNLSSRVRCIIPVHLFGATVDLEPLLELTRATGIHVIEDACQAHGARYRGQRVGSHGTLGCFSFYPTKNLGAWGDGGAVVTSDPELAERVQLLRSHGERPRYHHRMVGATARLDALQAAVLRRKLLRLDDWNEQRRRLGATLRERLEGGGVAGSNGNGHVDANGNGHANGNRNAHRNSPAGIDLVKAPFAGADRVYHLFVVRTNARDELRAHLAERGVASAIHYPTPIHLTEAYAGLGLGPGSLPVSERLAEQICSLPLFPSMTEAELEQVATAVLTFAEDDSLRPR